MNAKQIGQLSRDWHAIVDVVDVRAGVPTFEMLTIAAEWTAPHPPASEVRPADSARAARA